MTIIQAGCVFLFFFPVVFKREMTVRLAGWAGASAAAVESVMFGAVCSDTIAY